MTNTYNPPWEVSPAHEEHYHEAKHYVADLLFSWGSTTNSKWPENARFVSMSEPQMEPSWFYQIVHLGRAGIMKQIPGWRLTELFPSRTWEQWTHDVYFVEQVIGNVRKHAHAPTLLAYIVGVNYVRVVTLGCDHPNAGVTRSSGNYREFACPSCGYTWGVDTSD